MPVLGRFAAASECVCICCGVDNRAAFYGCSHGVCAVVLRRLRGTYSEQSEIQK